MACCRVSKWLPLLCSLFGFVPLPAMAQFTSNVQGVVQDSTGAIVPKAQLLLVNTSTNDARSAQTDPAGNYRFVSLAPGTYKLSVEASGFAKAEADFTLLTGAKSQSPNNSSCWIGE